MGDCDSRCMKKVFNYLCLVLPIMWWIPFFVVLMNRLGDLSSTQEELYEWIPQSSHLSQAQYDWTT